MQQNHSGPTIGHVHLKVSNLDRAVAFYRDVIGLDVMQEFGSEAAFLSSDGYHHHIGLNTWHSKGEAPAPVRAPGLYHTAFLYPDRQALAVAVKRALSAGVQFDGAADHGVSEAVYFRDPDGNGIELYRDRAEADWPRREDGSLAMVNAPLDVDELVGHVAV